MPPTDRPTATPTGTRTGPRRTALVSGAGIAGPAVAFWLNRYGFAVTVVEKAGTLRGGGRPVDLHRAKIRLADEVLVVGGHVGDSTRAEIAYARSLGRPVRFTHPEVDPDA